MSAEEDTQNRIDETEFVRAELYDTLGQLRDRLNFAARIDNRIERARIRVAAEQLENPVRFAVGVAAVAATVGVTVWGIASTVIRRMN